MIGWRIVQISFRLVYYFLHHSNFFLIISENWKYYFCVCCSSLEHIGYETAELRQQVALDPLANEKLKSLHPFYAASNSNSIFENVPRGCRSKRRVVVQKTTKAIESGTCFTLLRDFNNEYTLTLII